MVSRRGKEGTGIVKLDEFPIHFNAPWGDRTCNNNIDVIRTGIDQLEYYIRHNQCPDPEWTRDDIRGYRFIVDSGSEDLAHRFLMAKSRLREISGRSPRNRDVLECLNAGVKL